MSTPMDHEQSQELIGAYAVNALDPQESSAISAHVEVCEICRVELEEHLEVAALLSAHEATPPPTLWPRIEAGLHDTPPPLRLAPVKPRTASRVMPWVAGIAASLLIAFAAGLTLGNSDTPEVELARPEANLFVMERAAAVPGARKVMLSGDNNPYQAEAILLPDGRSFIRVDQLPALPPGRTYQLWVVMNGDAISAGVLGRDPVMSGFTAAGNISALALTEEVEGGVIESQNQPLLSGALPA